MRVKVWCIRCGFPSKIDYPRDHVKKVLAQIGHPDTPLSLEEKLDYAQVIALRWDCSCGAPNFYHSPEADAALAIPVREKNSG